MKSVLTFILVALVGTLSYAQMPQDGHYVGYDNPFNNGVDSMKVNAVLSFNADGQTVLITGHMDTDGDGQMESYDVRFNYTTDGLEIGQLTDANDVTRFIMPEGSMLSYQLEGRAQGNELGMAINDVQKTWSANSGGNVICLGEDDLIWFINGKEYHFSEQGFIEH